MTGRRTSASTSSVPAGSPGRALSRTEQANLYAHATRQPPGKRRQVAELADTAAGRARARAAGYTRKPQPAGASPPAQPTVAGVPVDLVGLVAGLRSTERGRAALRARGLE